MNQNWPGLIDEVRLWSVARTQAQIQQNRYHQLTATPGLVSSWRFNSDFHDSIGTNHGAAIGGVAFSPASCPAVPLLAAPALVPAGATLPFLISSPVAQALYAFDTATWPSIASVTPATGPHLGGTAVTIAGANFQQGASVKFGSVPATGVVLLGDGSLSCTSPAGSLGAVAITVLNPDGGSQTLAAAFTYVPRSCSRSCHPPSRSRERR